MHHRGLSTICAHRCLTLRTNNRKKAESGDAAMPSTNSRESTIGSSKRVYWQKKVGWLDAGGWPGVLGNGGFTPHLNSYITALL